MRELVGLVVVSVLLSGCGIAKQMEISEQANAAKLKMDADSAECDRLHPDKYAKPSAPRVTCFNAANLRYHEAFNKSVGNPYLDLVVTMNAQMSIAAEQYDSGKLSKAEFDLAKAAAFNAYNSSMLERQNNAAIVGAAQSQAAAARTRAAAAVQAAGPRSCTVIANTVSCY